MRMTRREQFDGPKKATNVSLSADLVAEAKRLGINVSQACEGGLDAEVRKARAEQWKRDNREAMEDWSRWIAENGIPYSEHRQI